MSIRITLFSAIALFMLGCVQMPSNPAGFLSHELELTIDIDTHTAEIVDEGMVNVQPGWNSFKLNANARIVDLVLDGEMSDFRVVSVDSSEGGPQTMEFRARHAGESRFRMTYKGVFYEDVQNIRFSNQKVGKEVTGTILEQGVYLSPAAYYYPQGEDQLMRFQVVAHLPENMTLISDGNPIRDLPQSLEPGIRTSGWSNPFLSDGLMFMAAPYVVKTMDVNGITAAAYFFAEDTSLFETYLPATARYLEMYSEMIGPYPYEQFTVAENFFPTGYGMPGWTLLGQDVLRLPFIVMTSLGHEVLHSWWGNSVYVDYERGNWCEGLTVYGADYHYKESRSAEAARDYRKDILKQYKSYVNAENDFPLRKFTSRSENYERTIGYNKAMMVFHMIRQEVGDEAFWTTLRDVYERHLEAQISWEEWVAAFELRSGQSLAHIIPQWIDGVGAVQLSLADVAHEYQADKNVTRIQFTLRQPENAWYQIRVPFRAQGTAPLDDDVQLSSAEENIDLTLSGQVTSLEIDPDYQIFRHLYPQEIEPIVAMVLGSTEFHFITEETDPDAREAFQAFGGNLTEDEVELEGSKTLIGREGAFAAVLLNPENLPPSLQSRVEVTQDRVFLDGSPYPRKGHTYILTAEEQEIFARIMVVLTSDYASLPRVGELVPHYGKYSYLGFKGSRNMAKGQWPAQISPLQVQLK